MHNFADIVLWIYIVLLVVGGLIGFLKGKSQVSLMMSAGFAALLILCELGIIFKDYVADVLLAALLVVFAWRLTKTKKFMPAGMMLVLTLAAEPRIRAYSHIDERSAGFFALGLAKASGLPVAVACTSGTAAAELMPAAVEAQQARVPLLLLTADRPADELRQRRLDGAQQKRTGEID